jgi:hypothetical protein
MLNTLRLLDQGRLPLLEEGALLSKQELSTEDKGILSALLAEPTTVFVGHIPEKELYAGVTARLDDFAGSKKFNKETLDVIQDRNGRAVFQIFHFKPHPENVSRSPLWGGRPRAGPAGPAAPQFPSE